PVGHDQSGAWRMLAQPYRSGLQHGLGAVEADHAAARDARGDLRRNTAGTAAEVEHTFVPLERQPLEHAAPPRLLRGRDLVVALSVPVHHAGRSVYSPFRSTPPRRSHAAQRTCRAEAAEAKPRGPADLSRRSRPGEATRRSGP